MDNFLEQLTLYDLVGYTTPGTLCVLVFGRCILGDRLGEMLASDIFKEYKLYIFLGVLVAGYLAGIIITEIGSTIYKNIKKINGKIKEGIGYEKIGYDTIGKALVNSSIIDDATTICTADAVEQYMGYMYGEVQVKSDYSRLHNYASMELVCQNMSVAIAIVLLIWGIKYGWSCGMIWGLAVIVLVYRRWEFFYQRKNFYAAAWFVQMHMRTNV